MKDMLDFSLKKLEALFLALKNSGKQIIRFNEYWDHREKFDSQDNVVLLRHDIDRFPQTALHVAQMEARLGIRGTYFFRIKPWTFHVPVIKAIADLGHEIGYHYECLADAKGDYEKAADICRSALQQFRDITPVVSAAMHSRPLSKWDNRLFWKKYVLSDFGLKGEVYLSVDHYRYTYLADSGRNWNADRLVIWDYVEGKKPDVMVKGTDGFIQAIENGKISSMQLQVHPNRWPNGIGGWICQYGQDLFINCCKRPIRLCKNIKTPPAREFKGEMGAKNG